MSEPHFLPLDPQALIGDLYRTLLHREVDAAGLDHYGAILLEDGGIARVVAGICESSEFAAWHRVGLPTAPSVDAQPPSVLPRPIRVVDLGAQCLDHEKHVYSPLIQCGYAVEVIGFEPLAHRIAEREAAESGSRLKLLPNFVGDGQTHTFHINRYDATSSLLPINRDLCDSFVNLDQLATVRTELVQTQKLDDLINSDQNVDFLKIDIQGFELQALQHAEATLARTLVVHCEVSFDRLYDDQCLFADIDQFLRNQGFELIDLLHQHRASYIVPSATVSADRLLWADAVFFKKSDALTSEQRQIQAVIAGVVYEKPGMAERLALLSTASE